MTEPLSIRHYNATSRPETFDEKTLSVRVIAATETPIQRWSPLRGQFNSVHLIEGVIIPRSNQVPLLDTHDRRSVSSVLGSARNFKSKGSILECDVFFSKTSKGKEAALKVQEGHLTDFSVGYEIIESHWIPKNKIQNINGRTFQGPIMVVSKWALFELSIAPVGADESAKARSADYIYMDNADMFIEEAKNSPIYNDQSSAVREAPQPQVFTQNITPPEKIPSQNSDNAHSNSLKEDTISQKPPDIPLKLNSPTPLPPEGGARGGMRAKNPFLRLLQKNNNIVDIIFIAFLIYMLIFLIMGIV